MSGAVAFKCPNELAVSRIPKGFKQTELGTVPEDWTVRSVGEFDPFVTSGSRGWAAYYSDRGSPFIRITNLSRECIYLDLTNLRYVSLRGSDSEAARTKLRQGDVLISITADIGIIGYVTRNVPSPSYINQHICLVRFTQEEICPHFVSYFLAAEGPQRAFTALTDSGAKAGLNLTTVRNLLIAVPPTVAEQSAIAEALTDADALIEGLESLIAKKRAIKQGAMQELLTGKRRLPGFKVEWSTTSLDECCAFITKGSTPTTYGFAWEKSGVLFLRSECVSPRGLDLSESMFISEPAHSLLRRSEVSGGDILMTITGNVGRVVQLPVNFGAANINQHIARIRVTPTKMVGSFLAHILDQDTYKCHYASILTGQAYPQISLKQVRETRVPSPSLPEQDAIAITLSDMDTEIETLDAKLTKARHVKQGMMQELLTGRIRLV